MIPRNLAAVLRQLATQYPVVTVTGPRQSGKTTLCTMVFPDKPLVSLEPLDRCRYARDDPRGFLVSCNSNSSHNSRAGHPGWRRCSSLEYTQYARSSRLAIRAPRSWTYATHHCYRTLAEHGAGAIVDEVQHVPNS